MTYYIATTTNTELFNQPFLIKAVSKENAAEKVGKRLGLEMTGSSTHKLDGSIEYQFRDGHKGYLPIITILVPEKL